MTDHLVEYNQDQQMLLAKDIRDWVKEDSLEQFVSDTIDLLDEEDGSIRSIQSRGRMAGGPTACIR